MITGERERERREKEMWIHYQFFCNTSTVLQFNSNSHIMFSTTGKLQTIQLQIKWFSTPVSRYSPWQVFFSFKTTYDLFHDGCLNRWPLYSQQFTITEPEKYKLSLPLNTSLRNPTAAKSERGLPFLSPPPPSPFQKSSNVHRDLHTQTGPSFGHLPLVSQHCTGFKPASPTTTIPL